MTRDTLTGVQKECSVCLPVTLVLQLQDVGVYLVCQVTHGLTVLGSRVMLQITNHVTQLYHIWSTRDQWSEERLRSPIHQTEDYEFCHLKNPI